MSPSRLHVRTFAALFPQNLYPAPLDRAVSGWSLLEWRVLGAHTSAEREVRVMAGGRFGVVAQQMQRLLTSGTVLGLTEGELLERFARRRDDVAFEALVQRYGPMVLGVCRGVLPDPNDADDAFQATFLVLARKAGSLRRPELLGNWLHGVARKVAVRARADAARRRDRPPPRKAEAVEPTADDLERAEVQALLHEEIQKLPTRYRAPIVQCYLEGRSHEEVAQRLGWPVGTVKGRLARAKDRLHDRLARRGVTAPVAFVAATLGSSSTALQAALPPSLVNATVKAAIAVASGKAVSGLVSASSAALMEGVLTTMFLTKLKTSAVVALTAGAVGIGSVGMLGQNFGAGSGPGEAQDAPAEPEQEPKIVVTKNEEAGPLDAARKAYLDSAHELREIAWDNLFGMKPIPDSPDWSRDIEDIYRASRRWVEAQQTLSDTSEDFIETLQQHRDRMIQLDELVQESEAPVFRPWLEKYRAITKNYRLEAELWLAEAQAQQAQGEQPELPAPPEGVGRASPPSEPKRPRAEPPAVTDPGVMMGMMPGMPGMHGMMGMMGGPFSPPPRPVHDDDERSRAILEKLEKPVTMPFPDETPLEEVLQYIKEVTRGEDDAGIPIYYDPVEFLDADRSMQSPVQIDVEGIPLRVSLRLLLRQLGLDFVVKEGLLIIAPEGSSLLMEDFWLQTREPE